MGWETSDRNDDLPRDWWRIRKQVLERDEHRCRWVLPSGARCPRKATEVDHMGERTDHRLIKLRAMCEHHHARLSSQQGHRERAKRKQGRVKRTEQHPGLRRTL